MESSKPFGSNPNNINFLPQFYSQSQSEFKNSQIDNITRKESFATSITKISATVGNDITEDTIDILALTPMLYAPSLGMPGNGRNRRGRCS